MKLTIPKVSELLKLTPAEKHEFKRAIGNGKNWPLMTSLPRVNWAVDCHTANKILPYEGYEAELEAEL